MTKGLVKYGVALAICALMCMVSVYGIIYTAWDHEGYGTAVCTIFLLIFLFGGYKNYESYEECDFGKETQESKRVINYDDLKENILFKVIEKVEENHWRVVKAGVHPSNYYWCSRIVHGLPDEMAKAECVFFKKGNEAYESKETHSVDNDQSVLCEGK